MMSNADDQALEYVVTQDGPLYRVYAQRGEKRIEVGYSRQREEAEDYAQALRDLQAALAQRRGNC
jgi:hypothetical protein